MEDDFYSETQIKHRFLKLQCGRQNDDLLLKPYVTFYGRRDYAGVIRLRLLRREDDPRSAKCVPSVMQGSL
jgi:hypothetical protein